MRAADINHDQAQRPADGRIGPPARTKHAGRTIDIKLLADWAVDNKQRRGRVGGALHAVQIGPFVAHGPNTGNHDRQKCRLATGHDRIHGDLLDRGFTKIGRHERNHFVCGL